jgi:two-component system, chemotaxis family, CheB/CheR fusion protein
VLHGVLSLLPRDSDGRRPHLPIDFFFRALAADCGSHAIGVVLSGTATDGTEGLKAIKAENGITFAQDPATAKFGGMPESAISAGAVDRVLPVTGIAGELVRLSRHPHLAAGPAPERSDASTLTKIFLLVRNAIGIDFSEYKSPTFERRLGRRMALRHVDDLQAYLGLLQAEPGEVRSLYEDALIHVTSFFRDAELFESLATRVFPQILKGKADGAPIRLWVTGCSTGEEVYSLGIALLEYMAGSHNHPIQIFGSDVSEKAIEKARLGVYSDAAVAALSEERRRRFFRKVDIGYQINKNVRDLCVFVRHDLARDPPFSRLDVVSCRNVLIYFASQLQKRVLLTLHYALCQPGFLLLGRSESISGFHHLFTQVSEADKVFARAPGAARSSSPPARRSIRWRATAASRRRTPGPCARAISASTWTACSPPVSRRRAS